MILCLSGSPLIMSEICQSLSHTHIFLAPVHPFQYSWRRFQKVYQEIQERCSLQDVQLILAENVDALGVLILMRLDGYRIPTILFPHINAFPLEVLMLYSIFRVLGHEDDVVVCGCADTAQRYRYTLGIQTLALPTFGITDDFYPMDPRWCRQKLQLSQDEKIIVFAGRFAKDKALPQLLHTVQRLQKSIPVRLVLILSSVEQELWQRHQHLLADTYVLHDVSKEELRLWYNAADIFSFPGCSIFETWGRAPIEAILCNTPVVLADWCGFREYVLPANGRLCPVTFSSQPAIAPFHYAGVRNDVYYQSLYEELNEPNQDVGQLPEWTRRSFCMQALSLFVHQQYEKSGARAERVQTSSFLSKEKYSEVLQLMWDYFRIDRLIDFRIRDQEISWLNRGHRGSDQLIRRLYEKMYRCQHPQAED